MRNLSLAFAAQGEARAQSCHCDQPWEAMMNRLFIIALLFFFATSAMGAEPQQAAKIIVYKEARKMELLDGNDKIMRRYNIALGANPKGHKIEEGDEKTPEGLYEISGRNPNSRYHLSLRISYPNAQDIAQADRLGVSPGGDIMIHGLPNDVGWWGFFYRFNNRWTNGCIAVTNKEIEEIWNLVADGTPIDIRP
jgi:murein L,D-transpeptidase YafK